MKRKDCKYFIFALLVGFLVMACNEKEPVFKPIVYFPVHDGNTWEFSGSISKILMTETGNGIQTFQLIYYDTLDTALWSETHVLQDSQLYWKTFEPNLPLFPRIMFSPPLPYAPMSERMEFSTSMVFTETQTDSATRRSQIRIDYNINRIETVITPAGTFHNCLRMKIAVTYLDVAASPVFAGEHVWWYARGVGPVKYELPSAEGELLEYTITKVPELTKRF
ncbi:MAG: hypothetical protein U5R06_19505 [candidate division KSB1 bacterium]|nr:hypothetical protein [candidate division KSB1 bacterium]